VLVDRHARAFSREPEFVEQRVYGRLDHILSFTLPSSSTLGLREPAFVVMVVLRPCDLLPNIPDLGLDIRYYKKLGREYEVVDLACITCAIGRVRVGKTWSVIDRTGALDRAWYIQDDPTPQDIERT
jgi:hypothetical protein